MNRAMHHSVEIDGAEVHLFLSTSVLFDILNYVKRGIDGQWRHEIISLAKEKNCVDFVIDLAAWEYSVKKETFPHVLPNKSSIYRCVRAVGEFFDSEINEIRLNPIARRERIEKYKKVSGIYNSMYPLHCKVYPGVHEMIMNYLNIAKVCRKSIRNNGDVFCAIKSFTDQTNELPNLVRVRYLCIKYLYNWSFKAKGLGDDMYNTASDLLFQYHCDHSIGLNASGRRINLVFVTFDKEENMVDREVTRKLVMRSNNEIKASFLEVDLFFLKETEIQDLVSNYLKRGVYFKTG